MTGSSGGQQPAETYPPAAEPAAPAGVRTHGQAESAADVRAWDEAEPVGEIPERPEPAGDEAPGDVPGPVPAPHQRPALGGEPSAAGPFGGASPTVGSPWLGPPGTFAGPPGIEPTTGAPLAMLPQRAPRATAPMDFPGWDGPITSVPTTLPGADPGPAEDDGEDFWLPIEEVHWDGTPVQPTPRTWYGRPKKPPAEASPQPPRPPKPPRNPALGLASVILFSLVASFFAWVSAEPFWLAVGHGDRGTATVTSCTGQGLGQHCRGEFTAENGLFTAPDVRLVGVEGGGRDVGTRLTARMIDADGPKAYVGAGTGLLHLRWSLGLGVILLCCAGISWATGALRLTDRRSRHRAALVSVAGPLLLTAGFLVAAY